MGDYYGIIGKRALGEVSPCYRKIFSVCSSFHCTGRGNRNEDKYAKRSSRTLDCYGYDDEMSSQFHKELAIMFDDPFERAEEERLELEREELRQCEIRKARIVLSMLQPLQRERLMKNVCCGLSSRAIAKQEGVYYSSVDKSIAAAKKNFIKFYENL